jgi:hypothetical protein
LKAVAAMALRLRRSQFMNEYFKGQISEEKELSSLLGTFDQKPSPNKRTSKKK